jgi:hypothetical protein
MTITPPLVIWEKGEGAAPKTISLKAMPGLPVTVVSVGASQGKVSTRLETVSEGKEYRVVVTPNGTDNIGFSVLTIETEFKDQKKSLRAYAQVKETRR